MIVEAAQLGEPKSRKATSKSRINTDILYEQETRREVLRILTKLKKDCKSCDRDTGKFIWETFKKHAYEYLITETKKHKKAKEKSTEYIRLGELENSLRKIQNSKEPPSIERITKIQKIKAEIKAEAARIRPAGPKLTHNRYEREEECTTQFFRKFRTKHANTNINELYTVENWNDRTNTEEAEHTTTDETELLTEASKYYEWLYSVQTKEDRKGGNPDTTENAKRRPNTKIHSKTNGWRNNKRANQV